jgi:putative ABC transport system ATP-binding protein
VYKRQEPPKAQSRHPAGRPAFFRNPRRGEAENYLCDLSTLPPDARNEFREIDFSFGVVQVTRMPTSSEALPTGPPLSVQFLMRLGQVTGRRFDLERVRLLMEEMHGAATRDPLAHLAVAVKTLGLRLTPARLPLSEAVWHSHLDTPVILWSEPEQRYLIVSHAGTFQVKLALYGDAELPSETITRSQLAARLGLASVNDVVEVGIVHPLSPGEAASVEADHQAKQLALRYGALSHRRELVKHGAHGHAEGGHHSMPPFRRFLKILRPERRDILLLLVFAMFSGVLYLALPFAVDTVVTLSLIHI